MHTSAKIVVLALSMAACALHAPAQQEGSRLPPFIAAPEDDFSLPPRVAQHTGDVQYADGQLKILADNSSLDQILTEIGSKIGMKISGDIGQERVFGVYGPGNPTEVVADLLSGAGRNMLLREDSSHHPRELILTPRTGAPSPPPATAGSNEPERRDRERQDQERDESSDSEDAPPPPAYPVANPRPIVPIQPAGIQPGNQQSGNSTAGQPGTTQQSPNGARTPQQIYDQLMQLQNKAAPR